MTPRPTWAETDDLLTVHAVDERAAVKDRTSRGKHPWRSSPAPTHQQAAAVDPETRVTSEVTATEPIRTTRRGRPNMRRTKPQERRVRPGVA